MNAKPLAFAAIALAAFATAHAAGPKPAPELQKAIDAFAGSWTIEEEYPPSPDLPKGGAGHGTETWRAGPGNLSLVYDYNSDTPHGHLTATAILWWDARAKTFRELWCTSASQAGCTLSPAIIRWDGNELVFTESFLRGKKRIASREVWADIKADSHTMTILEGEHADALKPWIILRAARAK